jgi:hypothetical protein
MDVVNTQSARQQHGLFVQSTAHKDDDDDDAADLPRKRQRISTRFKEAFKSFAASSSQSATAAIDFGFRAGRRVKRFLRRPCKPAVPTPRRL